MLRENPAGRELPGLGRQKEEEVRCNEDGDCEGALRVWGGSSRLAFRAGLIAISKDANSKWSPPIPLSTL